MPPPVVGHGFRRGLRYLVVVVWCLLVVMPRQPVEAQTYKPDLIPLVIPAGPPAVVALDAPTHFVVDVPPARPASAQASAAVEHHTTLAPKAASTVEAVRATELRGLLPHALDRHYFGLEAIQPGDAFAVTLTVEPAAALQDPDAVNFLVLTESGLQRFLAGADPRAVKVAMGSPMIFDQVGNRLTALAPGSSASGYTVIVYNNGPMAVTYTLQVQGGLLRDDAGQTFAAVTVDATEGAVIRRGKPQEWLAPLAPPVATMDVPTAQVAPAPSRWAEPVRARRLSGTLLDDQAQHFFTLAAEGKHDEIHVSLQLPAGREGGFWVLTQDGVRAMVLGGLPQELNLATGLPTPDKPGEYTARLRLARNVLYKIVLFHNGDLPTDYALTVEGGVLVDQYGQTNEAYAAALEVWALNHK